MKRKITTALMLGLMLCVTGCSSGSGSSVDGAASSPNYNGGEGYEQPDAVGSGVGNKNSGSDKSQQTQKALEMDMLVYSCDMSVDVLEFDKAIEDFRSLMETYGGFLANEKYSDDQGDVSYYRRDQEVWHDYVATVRIPSKDYEAFIEGVAGLGDLRKRTSKVENVSNEYRDAKATLAIYEAKQERYLNLLKTIVDDAYALEVEKELTAIEIEIAKLKTQMKNIETDVAYSYVNVRLHEVREYIEEPAKTDTFGQRLKVSFYKSWSTFVIVMEKCLIVLIYLLPYLIISAVITVVILRIVSRASKKKRRQEGK